MEDDDGPSHGGGSRKGGMKKMSASSSSSSSSSKRANVKLKEGDPDYPKDIPKGSAHYEVFWNEEMRDVIDQGARRLCWTISSTRNLSAQLLIEKKVESQLKFSAIHLLVGLYNKTDDKGGLRQLSHLKKFMEESGAVLEEDCECVDPVFEMKNNAKGKSNKLPKLVLCTHKGKPKRVFRVKEQVVLTKVNEEELIKLVSKGTVSISIVLHPEFEKFTGDGIYKGVDELEPPSDLHMVFCSGYGTLDGIHYWKIQNSAGRKWGNNGFGKIIRQISRGRGKPSLIHAVNYPVLLDDYE